MVFLQRFTRATPVVFCLAVSMAGYGADLSVTEIRLGSRVGDATSAIRKSNSAFHFSNAEVEWRKGSETFLLKDKQRDSRVAIIEAETNSEAYVIGALDGSIYYVLHAELFPVGGRPAVNDLKKQLTDKFGAPSLCKQGSAWSPCSLTLMLEPGWIYATTASDPQTPSINANGRRRSASVQCLFEFDTALVVTSGDWSVKMKIKKATPMDVLHYFQGPDLILNVPVMTESSAVLAGKSCSVSATASMLADYDNKNLAEGHMERLLDVRAMTSWYRFKVNEIEEEKKQQIEEGKKVKIKI